MQMVKKDEHFRMTSLYKLRKLLKDLFPNHVLYDFRTTFYSRCKECHVEEPAYKFFMGHSLGALGNAYTDLSD